MGLLNDQKAVKVIATKSAEGNIHAIQVGSAVAPDPHTIIVGAILMKQTSKNLEHMREKGELVSILVSNWTASYQVKSSVKDYVTSGQYFDSMNAALKSLGLAAKGVWVLEPREVWNQSPSYEAGKRIA